MGDYVIGVDLGGTNMLLAVIDRENRIVARFHQKTQGESGPHGVMEHLKKGVEAVLDEASIGRDAVGAIGIAVAGAVDVKTGVVLRAANLDWTDFAMRDDLRDRLKMEVVIDNDVNAAAWGEYTLGAGRGSRDMFAVWVGTGIGGGLVIDGELYHGVLSTAGEFGQGVAQIDGGDDRRVVEDFAGRAGIQRLLDERLPHHPESMLYESSGGDGHRVGTRELDAAYEAGDGLALEIVGDATRVLGTAIANVVTLLSLDRVVIGGGLTEALGEPYLAQVREQFERDVFPERCRACRLVMTELTSDAGVLGAGLLARR